MYFQELFARLKSHNLISDTDEEHIYALNDGVFGKSIFINILLTFGAFIAAILFFVLAASIYYTAFSYNFRHFYIVLIIASVLLLSVGYWCHSIKQFFWFRLSSFFLISGKLTVFVLIFDRGQSMLNKGSPIILLIISALILVLAFLNIKIAKSKFEAFAVLLGGVYFFSNSNYFFSYGHWVDGNSLMYIYLSIGAKVILVLTVFYFLFKNRKFDDRLPFYALLFTTILEQYMVWFTFNFNGYVADLAFSYEFFMTNFARNIVYVAAIVILIYRVYPTLLTKITWQAILGACILLSLCLFGSHLIFLIIFSLVFGYQFRDNFILYAGYILIPTYIIGLYYSTQMTLDAASIYAMIIGLASLGIFGILRFTRINRMGE